MTEELNQVQDMSTEESNGSVEEENDLFGDYDPSKNESTPTESDEENNQTTEDVVDKKSEEKDGQQVAGSPDQTPFLEIKYNKAAKSLTKDEAVELAQKGMNYDNILGKYNALKDQEVTLSGLSKLAQKANMSIPDLMNYLNSQWEEHELDDEISALQEQYGPDANPDLLAEVARTRISDRSNLASQKQQESINSRKQEIGRQMDIFAKRYPNVDATKLDSKVYSLMKQNYTLLEAYESVMADKRAIEDKQRESQEKITRLNEENKKRSLGNIENKGYEQDNDDFVKALFSD